MASVTANDPVLTITPDHINAITRVVSAMRAEPDRAFNLDILAEIASFSSFHFARLFRQVIGIPPGEFLTALRYDRAKELLITSDLSITDVCFEVGYDSLGTFSTRFKRLVGVGPATFRALPDVLDTLGSAERADQSVQLATSTQAEVHGHYMTGGELPGQWNAYVGLFPASIARSRPVSGVRIAVGERFVITGIPKGDYKLLSAAVPAASSAISRLLPETTIRVAVFADAITIATGDEIIDAPLMLRAPNPHDPPILIALPALDFPSLDMTVPVTRDAFAHLAPSFALDASQAGRSGRAHLRVS